MDRTSLEDQIAACINSVRENPDAFACQYPCNYSSWRNDVISPPRGGLAASGTDAVKELQSAAYQHSLDMAKNNFFSHTGSDGSGLEDRAANANFYTFPLGENIAAGYISVRATGCGFDSVGTGAAFNMSTSYKVYFTQDFGCSRDDFNCQCPEVVSPATGQPAPVPPEPSCGQPPAPAAAAGQALGGAKVGVPTSSAKAPAPAPQTPTGSPRAPAPAPGASKVTGAAAAAAKTPASAPSTAPAAAPPVAAKRNVLQTGTTPAPSPSAGAARTGAAVPAPAPAAAAANAPTSAAAYSYAPQPAVASAGVETSPAQSPGAAAAEAPVAVLAAEYPAAAVTPAPNGSTAAGVAPASSPASGASRPLGLYATSMELPGTTGALAATNQPTAVIVASLGLFAGTLTTSDVSATSDAGASIAVSDVQPFPDEPATYMIEVLHPAGFTGTVTVSLPGLPALQPLTYSVVSRDLVVQSLGFSICPLSFGAH
ncbi:hypothetical protein COCSUDRAFT_58407 [Coccomyxa subellipsoidea C-169]|uniref:SCP domain-containing protein n=1 Tax=Coccomyxa subellipsoidea (strain C-169) TaxID=574566 RepID=I0YMP4_COCSC|nr:hypothetical protein COCSUDRAFT_58407 [Coccomyxa subellipsoidea C-169]EIE19663.1 hypothetical protein COCSUDRAFT_58407 [Coccomyxa subellipsoidea C-169]|eukprot:XP_005644207.1 hypothetical protein COCSUDRAFT_58407 [Coccomyxa subellipsoidea C-169]